MSDAMAIGERPRRRGEEGAEAATATVIADVFRDEAWYTHQLTRPPSTP